jgi:hypothetical protein
LKYFPNVIFLRVSFSGTACALQIHSKRLKNAEHAHAQYVIIILENTELSVGKNSGNVPVIFRLPTAAYSTIQRQPF